MTSSIHHNNNTGRWLSVFKAVWHPAMEDVVAVGSLARPRQVCYSRSFIIAICLLKNSFDSCFLNENAQYLLLTL